ncbi:hypothetical protein Q8F55_008092 [Vanrija albida]|uniref:Uncharacterized protein n=1 Tax=Vanrija albida TaxID=181172 RepID=A0ABR3PVE1_9TREE
MPPHALDLGINLFAPDRSPLPSPLPRAALLPPSRPPSPSPSPLPPLESLAPADAAALLAERAAALDLREADLADFSADVDTHHAALDDYAASLRERARELETYEHKLFKYHRAVRRERLASRAPTPLVVISEPVFQGHQYEALVPQKVGDPELAERGADEAETGAEGARRAVLAHSGGDVRALLSRVTEHIALLDRLERSSVLDVQDEGGRNALRALALLDLRIRQVLKRAVWAEESQSDTGDDESDDSTDEFVEYGHCSVVAHVRHGSLPLELD